MSGRARDWRRQAEADVEHARHALADGHHEWACFAAQQAAEKAAKAAHEVRVFGSLARGDAGPGSDADVLVVLRDGAAPFLERVPSLARAMSGAGIGCDVVAYTESELTASRARADRFARTVLAEGLVLARRSEPATA